MTDQLPAGPDDLAAQAGGRVVDMLAERSKERAELRDLIGVMPPDWTWPEWQVALYMLAPDPFLVPGTAAARRSDLAAARDIFPALAAPQALRAYREARDSRRVREFVADFKALEAVPLFDLRSRLRTVLLQIAETPVPFGPDSGEAHGGWAKAALARVAAVKALVELDGLQAGGPAELAAAKLTAAAGDNLGEQVYRAASAAYQRRREAAAQPQALLPAPSDDGT